MGQFGFGQSVRRVEDDRLVVGKGQYTDDISIDGQAYAYFLRSPTAHAKIAAIDVSEAKRAPGVIAVLTGQDAENDGLGDVPCAAAIKSRDGSSNYSTKRRVIALDRVRYVGDTVAMVVAETVNQAKDAAELIVVDYDDLPVVANMETAIKQDAPLIWEENESNVIFDWGTGDEDATKKAFDEAAHITSIRLINNRLVVNAMEPRACIGQYDAQLDHYTLNVCSQGVHGMRNLISNFSLKVAPEKLRVITHDVGGGFGMKNFNYPEYTACLWASKITSRPVKWTGERSDAFVTDTHGRDHISECSIAFDSNAKATAVKVDTLAGLGAYLSQFAVFIPTMAAGGMQIGIYDIGAVYNRVRGIATNTTPVDAYRGAGRPEAAYVIERLMEKAAHELNLSVDEIRRRNYVQPEQMPYKSANRLVFDSGEFEENTNRAMKAADWAGFEGRKKEAEAQGKLLGRGMSYYVEKTATVGLEMGRIEVRPSGEVIIAAGTQNNGQGHETAYAQIISEFLDVPFDSIQMENGDSDTLPKGGGTGGSRSLTMATLAYETTSKELIEKGKVYAAKALETTPENISYEDAAFKQTGSNEFITLFDVAKLAAEDTGEAGLIAMSERIHKDGTTFPNGCHICEAEIDPETGVVKLTKYTAVDDFGRILNPMLVAGQVHGGVVQGIGQVMGEEAVYDSETGQLITGSFMDYWMPRAADIPHIDFSYNEVLAKTNAFGLKGAGEAGTVAATPVVVNAVIDALRPYGVTDIDMPITPLKIWKIINEHSNKAA